MRRTLTTALSFNKEGENEDASYYSLRITLLSCVLSVFCIVSEQKGKYKQTVSGFELKELPSARYLSSLAATHVVATTLCITLLMLPTRPTGLNHGFRTERTVLIYQFLQIVTVLQKCTFNGAHSDGC